MIPTRIIVHCSASKNGVSYPIEQIRKDHRARGFTDVGYHIVIQPDGQVDLGRGLNQVGAHCEGENYDSIAICMIGDTKFTDAQFKALRYQLDSVLMTYPTVSKADISCHYCYHSAQVQGKTCPNILLNHLLCWFYLGDEKAISSYKFTERLA